MMMWRVLQNPEAVAAWKWTGRRVPFVEVKHTCGRVGIIRSKSFARGFDVEVRCCCGGVEVINKKVA